MIMMMNMNACPSYDYICNPMTHTCDHILMIMKMNMNSCPSYDYIGNHMTHTCDHIIGCEYSLS